MRLWNAIKKRAIYILAFILPGGAGIIVYALYYVPSETLRHIASGIGAMLLVASVIFIFLLVENLFAVEREMKKIISEDFSQETHIASPWRRIRSIEATINELKKSVLAHEQNIWSGTTAKETLSLTLSSIESVVQNVHDEIVATDEMFLVKFFNKAAGDLFGVTSAEAIGKKLQSLITLEDMNGNPYSLARTCEELWENENEKRFDVKNYLYAVRRDGQKIPVAPIISMTGEPDGATSIIFVFHKIETELEIQKLRDEFVFIAAHELRTPVTIIAGYIELIEENRAKLPPENIKDFENIKAANMRLSNLVDDLLQVARAEANKLKIEVRPMNAGEIIQEVIKNMEPLFKKKSLTLIDISLPSISEPLVLSDPMRLREIVANLVSNAVKYTPNGGTITIKQNIENDELITAIEDTGMGIPEKERKNVFERFWRSEKSRSTEGTGLGLFIVKQLVERMNGKIWFQSKEDKGTTFFFSMPIARINQQER